MGQTRVAAGPGDSVHAQHVSRVNSQEVAPNLYFHRDPKEIENKEWAAAGKAVTGGGTFRVNGPTEFQSLLLLKSRLQISLRAGSALCAHSEFHAEYDN